MSDLRKDRKKKRWVGYRQSLIGIQKLYREYYESVKNDIFPCSKCNAPTKVWLSRTMMSSMAMETYCIKCDRDDTSSDKKEGVVEEEEADTRGSAKDATDANALVDVGVLDMRCFSCDKGCASGTFCTSCCGDNCYSWPPICCHDCKTTTDGLIEECSMCATTNCADCQAYDIYLKDLAVEECKKCNVKACGICRENRQCEGHACSYNHSWYCSDCEVLRECAKCGKLRCESERNACRASCSSCDDIFCSEMGYALFCLDELERCNVCGRSFCSKESCPNVKKCSLCASGTCDECAAEGKGKKYTQCTRCKEYYCNDSKCLEWSPKEHSDCKEVDPKEKEAMMRMQIMMDAGGSTSAGLALLPSSQESKDSDEEEW